MTKRKINGEALKESEGSGNGGEKDNGGSWNKREEQMFLNK